MCYNGRVSLDFDKGLFQRSLALCCSQDRNPPAIKMLDIPPGSWRNCVFLTILSSIETLWLIYLILELILEVSHLNGWVMVMCLRWWTYCDVITCGVTSYSFFIIPKIPNARSNNCDLNVQWHSLKKTSRHNEPHALESNELQGVCVFVWLRALSWVHIPPYPLC